MSAFAAVADGIRRVLRAPAVWFGVWALTIVVSLPLAVAVRDLLKTDLGSSLVADRALTGVDYEWMQEFAANATGIGTTFKPTIIGFAAVLDNLSAILDNEHRPAMIAGAAAVYILAWLFLAGGIVDRLARNRPTRANGFFSASGVYFFRFLRLAVLMGIAYGLLFQAVHPWLFGTIYPRLTRDVTVERTAFGIRVLLYVVFLAALAAFNIVFDYAKVRAVVEDRRSMLGAVGAAVRFIRRHFAAAAGLYLIDVLLFLIVIALYALVAPNSGGSGWSMWLGFVVGQLYVAARLWVKLVFWASEASLFQQGLAHAGYVANPEPPWPESPAVEAISRT